MLFQLVHNGLFAYNNTRLGAAQELIAGEAHHIHPGPDGVLNRRLAVDAELLQIHQAAAAQILDHRQTPAVTQLHQLRQGGSFAEAHDAVVAGVNLHKRPGLFGDGPVVVPQVGLVGGAHFLQLCAAGFHNIRHPEGAADFHQLPTGGDDLPPLGHIRQDQKHGGGVVVHHQGTLRPGQAAQKFLHMAVTGAPLTGLEVVFQGGIGLGHRLGSRRRPVRNTGTAQVGMQNDAGGVDDLPQRGLRLPGGIGHDLLAQASNLRQLLQLAAEDIPPEILQNLPHRLGHILRRNTLAQLLQGRLLHQLIHLGDLTQKLLIHISNPPDCFLGSIYPFQVQDKRPRNPQTRPKGPIRVFPNIPYSSVS